MATPNIVQGAVMAVTMMIAGIIGTISGRHVKDSRDFAVSGQKAGALVLTGMLMGIVGGAATVGAAQLAFEYGLTGWCFTLGGGIACLAMGLFYAGPLRRSGAETIPEYISSTYGPAIRIVTGTIATLAMFIQVVGQILSSVALLKTTFGIESSVAIFLSVGLMVAYVLFGGAWGAGMVGIVKSILIYFTLAVAGVTAYRLSGGFEGLKNAFPSYPWLNLLGRGLDKDGAGLIAVIIGLLSTQTYLQVMFAGRDIATCRKAAFLSAVLIPPTGLASVLVGMYMRINHPGIESAYALPAFFLQYTNPVVGGMAIAALILAVVGTGAGLALGMSLMIAKDIYGRLLRKKAGDREILFVSRAAVVAILLLSIFFAKTNLKSIILSWAYLSMAIRGSSIFLLLVVAMYTHSKFPYWVGVVGATAGPLAILFNKALLPSGPDSIYIGITASTLALAVSVAIASMYTRTRNFK
ncbi:Sodium/solute symporter [Moorella glycerini]|uniref:Sodium/proline symporter n=1 Tax=Neomoorella stamsii TaxID=1266720 RepID=A0A9X7J0P4_9FIRM|nr:MULTISPECIES: sodium:solute symporter family protein [Moorella]PRR70045.1 Sodium/proline symporter [Moorella stamsii]CEP68404.1 Sodium/solute symporter [Moorella glycerini]